jgi:hypothetical protein
MAHHAVSALSDTLHRALAESLGATVCLVIDPSLRPLDAADNGLGATLRTVGVEPQKVPCPGARVAADLMPCLVPLCSDRGPDSAALFASIEEALLELDAESLGRGNGRRVCGWLQSSAPVDVVARHIGRQFVQHRPPGRPTLFRWTDPAALWAFWPALVASQQAALLGPIRAYRLLDPCGGLVTLQGVGCAPETPLNLSAAQWADADSMGALSLAFRQCDAARSNATNLAAARDAGVLAMRRARARGFLHLRDLAAYARFAMNVHPRFDAHPLVRRRLDAAIEGDHIGMLLDDLSDADWQRIRTEIARNSQPATDE